MNAGEFLLRSRRVVRPQGVGPASIWIRNGRIAAVLEEGDATPPGIPVTDVHGSAVIPGVVDTHVHINEPGRTEWEGFETATRAAAAGGVTTVIDMPLNSVPPTTSVESLHDKLEAAAGRVRIHVGFWGGLVPDNLPALAPLRAAGVFGFKCFLSPSGVPEFGSLGEKDLELAFEELARIGAPLLVHAESGDRIRKQWSGRRDAYRGYLDSRPRAAENEAVERMIRFCRRFSVPVHILHLSSAEVVEAIAQAQAEGLPITAETCPHYLTFASEEIPDGATEFKCAPPIRERKNREKLWEAVADGVIGLVVSDHSPAPAELKRRDTGDFVEAWGGISSLELSLSATWTAAADRGFSLERLVHWMCAGPARLAGLASWKGSIEPGRDADLVVFDPEEVFSVDPARLNQRHKLTPYAGRSLKGVVKATYVKGEKVYAGGEFLSPRGEILLAG